MTNEEKYKTAEERHEAFAKFCIAKGDCDKCPAHGIADGNCRFRWLALEAEEEKPMPCPFCGNFIVVEERDRFRMYNATCNNYTCRYQAPMCNSKAAAIATHNRVCRAVKAYKESEVT